MSESDGEHSGATIELPEKTYFKIGEVAKLLDVEPYVLRYWETEFDMLDPEKTKSGQRVYQRHDIELLVQIKTLLYEEMFTIAGASRQIERNRQGKSSYFDLQNQSSQPTAAGTAVAGDEELREQLEEARRQLAATETELEDTQRKLRNIRDENSRLEGRLEDRSDETKETDQQVRQMRDKLEERDRELRQLREDAEQLREQNDELSDQLEEARRRIEQLDGEDAGRVDELRAEVAELEAQLEEARQEADRRRRQLERARQRDDERQQLLGSLRNEVETIAALADSGSRSAP